MKSIFKSCLAAFAIFASTVGFSAANAETARETGTKLAAKRGYSGAKAQCYASVFEKHASLRKNGNWDAAVTFRNRETPYVAELQSKCGISR